MSFIKAVFAILRLRRPGLSKLEAFHALMEHWAIAPAGLHPDADHIY
jgi:hypothetical protein